MEKKEYIKPILYLQAAALSQIIALSTDEGGFDGGGGWDAKDRDKKEEKPGNWNHLW